MTEFTRRCVVSVRKLYLMENIRAGQKPKWGDVHALDDLTGLGLVTMWPAPLELTPAGEALLDRAIAEMGRTKE